MDNACSRYLRVDEEMGSLRKQAMLREYVHRLFVKHLEDCRTVFRIVHILPAGHDFMICRRVE